MRGNSGAVWPIIILALGLSACSEKPETEATGVTEKTDTAVPEIGQPALPQPDRASAPLVPQESVNAEPIVIFGEETPIRFVGQEPDWEAIVDEGWIVFERPGLPLIEAPIPELPEPGGDRLSFEAGRLTLTFQKDACETPAGTLSIKIDHDEVAYQGCGGHQTEAAPEAVEVSWTGLIYDVLPAIDACLEAADGPRLIRALYPREENTVGMILMDDVGRYDECGANAEEGEISFFDPVTADQAEIWFEGDAVFERAESGAECRARAPQLDVIVGDDFGIMHPAGCR